MLEIARASSLSPSGGLDEAGGWVGVEPGMAGVVDEAATAVDPYALGEPVRRQSAVVTEMANLDREEQHGGICYQAPVAAPPQCLGAHDCDDLVRGVDQHVRQGLAEAIRGHVVRVPPEGGVAKRHVRRTRARPAEAAEVRFPAVPQARRGQPCFELDPAEVGVPAATRGAAHVDDQFHTCSDEQFGKLLTAHGAVPDGEKAKVPSGHELVDLVAAERVCRFGSHRVAQVSPGLEAPGLLTEHSDTPIVRHEVE